MTSEDAVTALQRSSISATVWRIVFVAVRSAVAAITLIAIVDREFISSKWLHWATQNWKQFLQVVFSLTSLEVHPSLHAILALIAIFVSTVVVDIAMRRGSLEGASFPVVRLVVVALLLGIAAYLWTNVSPSATESQARFDKLQTVTTTLDETTQALSQGLSKRSCSCERLARCSSDSTMVRYCEQIAEYEKERDRLLRVQRSFANEISQQVYNIEVLLGLILVLAVVAAPQMFLWLSVFVATIVGLNEVALLVERIPPPPG